MARQKSSGAIVNIRELFEDFFLKGGGNVLYG